MKILHVGPLKNTAAVHCDQGAEFELVGGLGGDGPSRSILGLAVGLATAGVTSGVLSTKPFQVRAGSRLNEVRFLTPYTGRKYDFFIRPDPWLDRIEQEFGRPDLVNFHDVYDLFSVALARGMRRRGWKYIVTPRGGLRRVAQQRDSYKKRIANPLFFRRYLRNAEFIHALAAGEAADVPVFDRRLKTEIVPNGLAEEVLHYHERLAPIARADDEPLVVGFLGQIFVEIKGVDILLNAIGRYQRGGGRRLTFVLAGPAGTPDDQATVDRLIAALPDPSKVVLTGPVFGRAKWELLNSFDVFILPSRTEGMPVVGLEAMALGKPCLFSRGSNMAEIISTARGGWDVGDSAERLHERLMEVEQLPRNDLRAIGARARQCVAARFTWPHVVDAYLAVVRRILPEGR